MNHEQISLNGAPVIGFGDAGAVPLLEHVPVIAALMGATGGAFLGALVKKGVGAAVGAVVGGLGGAIVAVAVAKAKPNNPPPAWRRLQPTISSTGVPQLDLSARAGQQLAVSIVGPNGASLPPADLAQTHAMLLALPTSPAHLPTGNFVEYPPGSRLPHDWPADDNLGPGAYRATADVLADAPHAPLALPPPSVLTIEIWVRP